MFRMTYNKGRHAPVFICDVCKRRIAEATDGFVLFGHKGDSGENELQMTVHRKCHRVVEKQFVFLHELQTVLVWLEQNLKFTPKARKQAESKAKFLSEIS